MTNADATAAVTVVMSAPVRRPPLAVVLVALVMLALGETAGAAMSRLKPEIQRYAAARVAANPGAHGFSGSAEYDDEVRERAIFSAEAGLSFFHLHGEGVGLVLFFASALVAALVPGRRARGGQLRRRRLHGSVDASTDRRSPP